MWLREQWETLQSQTSQFLSQEYAQGHRGGLICQVSGHHGEKWKDWQSLVEFLSSLLGQPKPGR